MRAIFRIVTAASIFDGHDAAINVFRRLFQASGLEVIHIGHNRSVKQLVATAIQEDADAICVSSYQGGHMEYFRYLRDLLDAQGGGHIGIFGGGGGTILPSEIEELHAYGITRLYHAEDGRKLGLKGIVRDAISRMHKVAESGEFYQQVMEKLRRGEALTNRELAKSITFAEQTDIYPELRADFARALHLEHPHRPAIIGFTGPGGSGKSSLMDELVLRYLYSCPAGRVGILAFDPTKKTTGGALLGDRIRMNAIYNDRVYLRSMATRASGHELSPAVEEAVNLMKRSHFDLILLETTGIGQGDSKIVDISDLSLYVMTQEYGASMQLEKIDMLDLADIVVLNKFEKLGSEEALEDVLHAYAYAHNMHVTEATRKTLPVFGTTASDFNNPGVTRLFVKLMGLLKEKNLLTTPGNRALDIEKAKELNNPHTFAIIPPERTFYLNEIAKTVREYREETKEKSDKASLLYKQNASEVPEDIAALLKQYEEHQRAYRQEEFSYTVRDKAIVRPPLPNRFQIWRFPK